MRYRTSVTLPISGPMCRRKALSSWFWMPRLSQNWAEQRSLSISLVGHTASLPTHDVNIYCQVSIQEEEFTTYVAL